MIKRVIVLTDFSSSAKKAADIAVELSIKMGAQILFYHAYTPVTNAPVTDDLEWMPVSSSADSREKSIALLKAEVERSKKQKIIATANPIAAISYRCDPGIFPQVALRMLQEVPADLVIMGKTCKPYRDLFFGSDTRTIVHDISCPILIVPDNAATLHIHRMVFATDLDPEDITAIRALDQLFAWSGVKVWVCHVHGPVRTAYSGETRRTRSFERQLSRLKHMTIDLREVFGDSVAKQLTLFTKSMNADVLAFGRKHHTRLTELLHQGEFLEDQLVTITSLPLLIFPPSVTGQDRDKDH